jgi:hypothetical protein
MTTEARVTLGQTVKDAITGFEGLVTGVADYLTGCRQVLVSPREADKANKGEWLDEDRLEVVQTKPFRLPHTAVAIGGPGPAEAPRSM